MGEDRLGAVLVLRVRRIGGASRSHPPWRRPRSWWWPMFPSHRASCPTSTPPGPSRRGRRRRFASRCGIPRTNSTEARIMAQGHGRGNGLGPDPFRVRIEDAEPSRTGHLVFACASYGRATRRGPPPDGAPRRSDIVGEPMGASSRQVVKTCVILLTLVVCSVGCGSSKSGSSGSFRLVVGERIGRASPPPHLVFAAVPSENNQDLQNDYRNVIHDIERDMHVTITFKTTTDYAGVVEGMRSGTIDMAGFRAAVLRDRQKPGRQDRARSRPRSTRSKASRRATTASASPPARTRRSTRSPTSRARRSASSTRNRPRATCTRWPA